ncbi:MAG: hypothetical protein QNJ60_18190 [Xenococcaceae cyanobacterium MO_188.B19]|nr:hypothetical protein [Xenococcaceae cyanobacterium MO_188.B19]
MGIAGKYNLSLQQTSDVLLNLSEPIAIQYFAIREYNPSESSKLGKIVKLSSKTGEIICDKSELLQLSTLENLKIFLGDGTNLEQYLFAKVIEVQPESNSFTVRFTGVPQGVKNILDGYLRRDSREGKSFGLG